MNGLRLLPLLLLAIAVAPNARSAPTLAETLAGSTCGTVSPDSRYACCQGKVEADDADSWCLDAYPELYGRQPSPVGAACTSRGPAYARACCEARARQGVDDPDCKQLYPELYDGSTPYTKNTNDLPFLAYVKGGSTDCAGVLVAPGYVLTAAQCVFAGGKAAAAGDVSVWVGGRWHSVAAVLVNTDEAQFSEFQNPNTEPSWDVAALRLAEDSAAPTARLPAAAAPATGEWLLQAAWDVPESSVLTALIPEWDGCPPSSLWADQFCAGGSGYLASACQGNKGAPILATNDTAVGLASGPGCDGASSGAFLRLADRAVLEQLTVWLQSAGDSGLDAAAQAWIREAYKYLYETPAGGSSGAGGASASGTSTPSAAANPIGQPDA